MLHIAYFTPTTLGRMKRLILFLLLLLLATNLSFAQDAAVFRFDEKSVKEEDYNHFNNAWKYKVTSDTGLEKIAYDDSGWDTIRTTLNNRRGAPVFLNDIAWFRAKVIVDSSFVNVPMCFNIEHKGASQIYLDGKLLMEWGVISKGDDYEDLNPENKYTPFTFSKAGEHIIAIRYYNKHAERNFSIFDDDVPGFVFTFRTVRSVLEVSTINSLALTTSMMLLFGIFIALAMAHFFLFLYQRNSRINLYYTVLAAALAFIYLLYWWSYVSTGPLDTLSLHFTMPLLIAFFYFGMGSFAYHLFGGSRLLYRITSACYLLTPIVYYINVGIGGTLLGVLLVYMLIEVIAYTIRGIWRGVPGAKIIGVGLLMFTVFMTLTILYLGLFGNILYAEGWKGLFLIGVAVLSILSLPVSMSVYLAWNFARVNKELKHNLVQVEELSARTLQQELEKSRLIEHQKEQLEVEVLARTAEVVQQKEEIKQQHDELKKEKHKADELLLNILPAEVADELKQKGHAGAKSYNDVTVLFTDFVNFTKAGEQMTPQQLVDELHCCFRAFDEIISKYGIEKIKTIGDAYLAVCGLPLVDAQHAEKVVSAALEINAFMKERRKALGDATFDIRLGIHSGAVVAGIVGIKKFAYDIWGDAVNTAARMEQSGVAGKINISEATYNLVKHQFECSHRGLIGAKNKGELNMYFVERAL